MSYLERNSQLIAEVGTSLKFQRGKVIDENKRIRFVQIGSYESALLRSRLYLGLKEYTNPYLDRMQQRIPHELAVMELIAKKLPHHLPKLPACYARLLGKNGETLGIVMEDFTLGGQITPRKTTWPPPDIAEIFIRGSIDTDLFDNMGIYIGNGQEKLMDFYPIFEKSMEKLNRRRLHQARVERNLHLYTLQIDYEL
ncbi:hypothetical protein KKE03_05165 [Patescibacteria group bacterium]|nr:hypothetical protein [Patescibacteria group bacterium]